MACWKVLLSFVQTHLNVQKPMFHGRYCISSVARMRWVSCLLKQKGFKLVKLLSLWSWKPQSKEDPLHITFASPKLLNCKYDICGEALTFSIHVGMIHNEHCLGFLSRLSSAPYTLKRLHFSKHFPQKLVYGSKSQKSWNWTENWQAAKQPERFSIFYEASNKS